jgi:hypothetical protein
MYQPLTPDERALLVSSDPLTQIAIRRLAEHFQMSRTVITRCQRQIRAGNPDVYLIQPPHVPKKPEYRYCARIPAGTPEAKESPLGLDPVSACDDHLVDLKRWQTPLSSIRVTTRRWARAS